MRENLGRGSPNGVLARIVDDEYENVRQAMFQIHDRDGLAQVICTAHKVRDRRQGCAGWHTFTDGPANANELRKVLTGLRNNTYYSPEVIAGQTQLEFSGGTLSSVFDEMKALYEAKKDQGTGEWNVKIPVYDSDDCSNPSGAIKIVGFATATVTKVIEAPDKEIIAKVTCDKIEEGRPGGTMGGGGFSPLSTAPALVF